MNLSEKTKITFTFANLITLVTTVFFIAGVWYHLDAQIQEAKELPKPKNDKIVREARRKLDVNRVLVEETRAVITEEIRRNHFVKALTKK